MDVLTAIRARRSTGRLVDPAPDGEDLEAILLAGAVAPDHGELGPVRFQLLRGAAKDVFGAVLQAAYLERCTAAGEAPLPAKVAKERTKLDRAPLVVVVSAVHVESDAVPWLEQQHAAAAACQNILLAATGLGYGSMWRTGAAVYDESVKRALGLDAGDAVVGLLYLGSLPADAVPKPPRAVDLTGLVREWTP